MIDIGSVFAATFEWVLVPLILLILFWYGFFSLPDEPSTPQEKKAAAAARWVGLILFVLFVLWRRGRGDHFSETMPAYGLHFIHLVLTAAAATGGYWFSRGINVAKGTKAFPAVVLLLSALTSIASYTYFFIWESRAPILFLVLGFGAGILLDRAFSSRNPVVKKPPAPDEP